MNNKNITHNLQSITTSRLHSIGKLYSYDQVNTSNVFRLHKAIKLILDTKDRGEVKVTVDVSHGEIIEIYQFLEDAIKAYKTKYNRTTVDRNMNIYQLIDLLNKLNPAQIIREVLNGAKSKDDSRGKSRKDFKEMIKKEMGLSVLR